MLTRQVFCSLQRHIPLNTFYKKYLSTTAVLSGPQTTDILATLNQVLEEGSKYGFNQEFFKSLGKQKIVVDFSSPNIAKMFHVGHFRSTVIGNTISNLMTTAGHDVHKINYLGDWGLQFALLAIGFERFGNEQLLQINPLQHLDDIYVKVNKAVKKDKTIYDSAQILFSRMENGEEEALKFWSLSRELSIAQFQKLYDEISINFDEVTGESRYVIPAKSVVKQMHRLNLLTEDGGRKIDLNNSSWISGKEPHKVTPVIVRENETTLYLTRDVAAALDRYDSFQFDKMIYITDFTQSLHFRQVFGIVEKMGHEWARKEANKFVHIGFGRVQNMRTRDGQTVFVRDILDTAYTRVREDRLKHSTRKTHIHDIDEVIKTLALTGLVCHDLRGKLSKNYTFSWDAVLASKGDHGLFLQYSHSRLYSLEQNCGVDISHKIDPSKLSNSEIIKLVHQVSKYGVALEKTYKTLEPSILLYYLYDLCHVIAKALRCCKVKGEDKDIAEAHLLCFHCARVVLSNGIKLLGITPLNEM